MSRDIESATTESRYADVPSFLDLSSRRDRRSGDIGWTDMTAGLKGSEARTLWPMRQSHGCLRGTRGRVE